MQREIYKVGLIGCGRIAKVHAEAVKQTQGLELSGVCDIEESKYREFEEKYKVKGYGDFKMLLSKEKPDLIAIATPNGTHYSIASACIDRGFHILLEKPVTIKVEDAEDLVKRAQKERRNFFAVKQVRYNPSIQILKSAVADNKLGRIFGASLVIRWTRPQEYFDNSLWRGTLDQDGGTLLNQGIHYVDIMQWIAGDVKSVFGTAKTMFHEIDIEDMVFGLLKFDSGALGTIEFTINTFPHNLECSISVLGEKGSVKLSGSAMNKIELWEVKDMPKPVVPEGFSPHIYDHGLYQGSCPNHMHVYKNVVRILRGENTDFVDGAEAIRSLKIVKSLYESSSSGKEVILD